MNYYIAVLKKYAVFTGRATRKEFWMFVLFSFIVSIVLSILDSMLGLNFRYSGTGQERGLLESIYSLAVFLPSLAVGVRRIHDINQSGWFILLPIYNLITMFIPGTKGANKYGEDPYGATPAAPATPITPSNQDTPTTPTAVN